MHDSAKTETLVNLPKCVKKQFSFAEIALLVQLHFKAFLVKLRIMALVTGAVSIAASASRVAATEGVSPLTLMYDLRNA